MTKGPMLWLPGNRIIVFGRAPRTPFWGLMKGGNVRIGTCKRDCGAVFDFYPMLYFLDACNIESTVANQNQTRLDELGYQKKNHMAPHDARSREDLPVPGSHGSPSQIEGASTGKQLRNKNNDAGQIPQRKICSSRPSRLLTLPNKSKRQQTWLGCARICDRPRGPRIRSPSDVKALGGEGASRAVPAYHTGRNGRDSSRRTFKDQARQARFRTRNHSPVALLSDDAAA
jgi:hypothetical protein